jgi:hypothetical protein
MIGETTKLTPAEKRKVTQLETMLRIRLRDPRPLLIDACSHERCDAAAWNYRLLSNG